VPVYLSAAQAKDGHLGNGLFTEMNRFEYPFEDAGEEVVQALIRFLKQDRKAEKKASPQTVTLLPRRVSGLTI